MAEITKFYTGWLTLTGWQALVATVAQLSGTLVQGLVVLTHPEYNSQRWQGTLMLWAVLAFVAVINITGKKLLARLEAIILVIHVLGFFAVIIPIVVLGSHREASEVFGLFINEGAWQTQGLSFMVGLTMSAYCFTGVFRPFIHLPPPSKK